MKKFVIIILCFFMLGNLILLANQNKYPLDTNYHNDKTLTDQIRIWNKAYPNFFYSEIIGYSNNDRLAIRSFKISKTPKLKDFNKPAILIVGQIHSEEPVGVEICLAFADYLLKKSQEGDAQAIKLLDAFEFYFIPTINPEGFSIVNNGIYYNHRKNKTDTNKNHKFNTGYDGVDLNRNFPFNWNNEEQFKPNERYYAGKAPASESETRAVMDFIKRENIYFAFNYHSSIMGEYNEKIFYPWNWTNGKSPHWYEMRETALILSRNLKKDYSDDFYEIQASKTTKVGFLRDWAYSEMGTFFYDIEACGIYRGKPIVFPKNEMLNAIISKNLNALLKALEYVRKNTLILRIEDKNNVAIKQQSICHYNLKNPYIKPKKTNEKGLVFIFVSPHKEQFNVFVNQRKYKINLAKRNTNRYTLKLNKK